MLYFVEIDHVKSGLPVTPEASRAFIENAMLSIARSQQLVSERKIVAGGLVVGRIALRMFIEATSAAQVDQIVSSLPLWPISETRVTPLVAFEERRESVQKLLDSLTKP